MAMVTDFLLRPECTEGLSFFFVFLRLDLSGIDIVDEYVPVEPILRLEDWVELRLSMEPWMPWL